MMTDSSTALQKASMPATIPAASLLPYKSPLVFKRITLDDLPEINRVVRLSGSLTCDYTIGGIYMWIDFFHYQYCIYRDTLFISGVDENHTDRLAFSCPVGALPLPSAIELLRDYCREREMPLSFSAVPGDKLACFTAFDPQCSVEELADWADYVYEAESFATLAGKKMAKKRNHVNHFFTEYPEVVLETITVENIGALAQCMAGWNAPEADGDRSSTHDEELRQVTDVMAHFNDYPFVGVSLHTHPGSKPVAMAMAEIIGETAFVHIEKMDHRVAGAGETIAHLFARKLVEEYGVKYLNREEDCGDEGLRRAKESWHPAMLLRKYSLSLHK